MNVQDTTIIERALQTLESTTGIKGRWSGILTLTVNKEDLTFNTEVKKGLRQHQLDRLFEKARNSQPFIVIVESLSSAVKQKLREEGIGYIDGAGNVYFRDTEKFIWIEGNKAPVREQETQAGRVFGKAGLKVVYTFLEQPQIINAPYREIADLAGVALGTINAVMTGLKSNGYLLQLNKRELALQNKTDLLEKWIDGYRDTLKPTLLLGTYHAREINGWRNMELPKEAVWGGESGAGILTNYLIPQLFTIYTAGATNTLQKILNLIPTTEGNLKIYQKFWKVKPTGLPTGVAPYLLTYADLLITEDPRCVETAQLIYDSYLKESIEE